MSNLITRSITGIVFSFAVMASAWAGPLALGMVFLFFAAVGLYELYDLLRHKQSNTPRWFKGMSVGILIYVFVFLIANDAIDLGWIWILAILIPVIFSAELIRLDHLTLSNLSITIFGWVYVILPFTLINLLPNVFGFYDYELPIGFFLVLWANDTGAYFIGKWFGSHKLYERVSPNKTWEGLFGGLFFSFVVAGILSQFFKVMILRDWLALAFIVSVFGNLGDLFESHLKRTFSVKDSGTIIPGHGGVLDRFDGLLLALPVLIAYFKLIEFL